MGSSDPESIPQHVAIIMDGNGRWAKERGLPRKSGHQAGAEAVREVVEASDELGIRYLTLYAFSSENWDRPKKEIDSLMKLLERFLKTKTREIIKQGIRIQAIGNLSLLPASCQKELQKVIDESKDNTALTLVLALSYGGREELTEATRSIAQKVKAGALDPEDIDRDTLAQHLYTHDLPDPDLLIRTSGEIRLSNFLLWQLSYAEILISKKYWPDFRKADFHEAITEYSRRHRRYGRI